VIVDAHTHVFPPGVAEDRERYLASDATFRELYADLKARLGSVEELLSSMDTAGIDASIALGFAWRDAEICRLHNDYSLESATAHPGRIIAFPNLPLAAGVEAIELEARRCVAAGARGFGELRPDNLGFDLAGEDGACLARLAVELDVVLLFHVTEPVGHEYPGKHGLALDRFYAFLSAHPQVKVVGAHWGGGLPFYASMPEARALTNVYFDTAASSLLYDDTVHRRVVDLVGPEKVLFGSDYPLLAQSRSLRRIAEAGLDPDDRDLILGGNAASLLNLS
jgi:predicted TIM-barrel fold metal-dependent hydrolase